MDEENKLIKCAQKGDSQAFTCLYRKYIKMIFGFVFNKIGKKEDTEDLTSEIWMAALKNLPQFSSVSSFKNWLFGIAKHKIMDYYKDKYKMEKIPLIEEIFMEDNNPNQDLKNRKTAKLLEALPANYRQVLSLRFLRGYTTAEIARELSLTVANVKVIQYRALKKAAKAAKRRIYEKEN